MNARAWTRLARALVRGRMPNYVIAFVAGRCNMRCSFCCHAATSIRETREMSAPEWGHAVSGADALLHVTITGGEPFVRRDLLDVISAIVTSSGVPRISINTNGFYTTRIIDVTRRLLDRFRGLDLCLSVSLEGPAALHDRLRGLAGAYHAARTTLEEAGRLRRSRPFSLRVTSVLQPDNAGVLGSFLEETATWPIDFHEIALVRDVPGEVQRALIPEYAALTQRQLERASSRFVQTIDWRLSRLLRDDVVKRVLEGTSGVLPSRPACLAGGRMLELMADGTVRGCELEQMWEVSELGQVAGREARLVDLVESAPARSFRHKSARCACSFECAATCHTVFDPAHWARLL